MNHQHISASADPAEATGRNISLCGHCAGILAGRDQQVVTTTAVHYRLWLIRESNIILANLTATQQSARLVDMPGSAADNVEHGRFIITFPVHI